MLLMAVTLYAILIHPQLRGQRWPTAPGKVLSAKVKSRWVSDSVDSNSSSSSGWYFRANIVYEYFIDERRFEGNKHGLSAGWMGSEKAAKKIVAEFPKGAIVNIHYNPNNAKVSMLAPRISLIASLATLVSFALFVFLVITAI
jgi:hypothetical protein